MKHYASRRFWRSYRGLPKEVRQLADRCYFLLKSHPGHRSLHFKTIGQFWSARVGLHYRALAVEAEQDLVWFWIGSHAEYDKLVGRQRPRKTLRPTRGPQRPARSKKKPRSDHG